MIVSITPSPINIWKVLWRPKVQPGCRYNNNPSGLGPRRDRSLTTGALVISQYPIQPNHQPNQLTNPTTNLTTNPTQPNPNYQPNPTQITNPTPWSWVMGHWLWVIGHRSWIIGLGYGPGILDSGPHANGHGPKEIGKSRFLHLP